MTADLGAPSSNFIEACRTVSRCGFSVVRTERFEQMRAWLDINGWPPYDWEPASPNDGSRT